MERVEQFPACRGCLTVLFNSLAYVEEENEAYCVIIDSGAHYAWRPSLRRNLIPGLDLTCFASQHTTKRGSSDLYRA
jgi:hypothetical protein